MLLRCLAVFAKFILKQKHCGGRAEGFKKRNPKLDAWGLSKVVAVLH